MLRVRSLDCQSETIHLDFVGYNESASVRGADWEIPGKVGRELGVRVKDVIRFTLNGYVIGAGTDPDARALSWRTATDSLMAVMDLSLAPGVVEVGPAAPAQFPDSSPYLGLTVDREINARCLSVVRGTVHRHMSFQNWSFEMEAIDPVWADSGSP